MIKSISVFCGSSPGTEEGYRLAAKELGELLAKRDIRLIYGGSDLGLMGEISQSVIINGGKVTGIMPKIFVGKGCEKCRFTGFKGRTAIHEILVINDEIRELIVKRTSANIIRDKAISQGMKTLRQDGLDKVCKGITTIEEVIRVTQQEEK